MKISLEALHALEAIDRKGSFALASEELNKVPSALTYTIRKLEDDLDVLLFDRRGRKAVLTEAGRELLTQGKDLLRAAYDLECRVKRVATGWESQLNIAVDGAVTTSLLWPLMQQFYQEGHITRLRVMHEVLGGSWEAMRLGRADIVIGAPNEQMLIEGVKSIRMGDIDWVFCMSPHHPLANVDEPLPQEFIAAHRIVSVADSSRELPARTVGILEGQEALTVADLPTKISAMIAGLGVGHLPQYLAMSYVQSGQLVMKNVERQGLSGALYLLHRPKLQGNAAKWWVRKLSDPIWWQSVIERFH